MFFKDLPSDLDFTEKFNLYLDFAQGSYALWN
jgi:hypothetical protein